MTEIYIMENDHRGPGIEIKQIVPRSDWYCYECGNKSEKDVRYEIRYSYARWSQMCKSCFIKHIDCMKNAYRKLSGLKDMVDEFELDHEITKELEKRVEAAAQELSEEESK